jgi:hypothetical protein
MVEADLGKGSTTSDVNRKIMWIGTQEFRNL